MQAVRRVASIDLDRLVDAGMVIAGAALAAVAPWGPAGPAGTSSVGPTWLLVLLPLLVGASLLLRRRAPLVMWIAVCSTVALQCLITGHPPRVLELVVLFVAAYSLGASSASVRRSAVGLGIGAVIILATRQSLSIVPIVAFWFVGVLIHARLQARSLAEQNAALQQQAVEAAQAERARIARELHDIVAHHLSVIVLQAAGARASGRASDATLEKIENSARQALIDTRRLLGVLRDPSKQTSLAPQPGIDRLDALTTSVRAAGIPVRLTITGDHAAVPAAVDVSVYRIVQEALTNILKHAGPARAEVTIGCTDQSVTIEVIDDGVAEHSDRVPAGGHGLAGMRERVAIFGGDLCAGRRPGGGFTVSARLPVADGMSHGGSVL